MSKRERKFLSLMSADLIALHQRGEIDSLTLTVALGTVSFSYIKPQAKPAQ